MTSVSPGSTLLAEMSPEFLSVLEKNAERLDIAAIDRALRFAAAAHRGQKRMSGEDFVEHSIAVASILAGLLVDTTSICAALLHDVVEDSDTTIEDLRGEFGDAIADLVATLSDDPSIESYRDRKDEHRGRVAAIDGDALAIYAADKLTNMTTLHKAIEVEGMRGAEEYDVQVGLKLEVWEADAAMLRHEAPELPLLDPLDVAISRLGADLKAASPLPGT